jgi:hypothetical protein
MSVRGQHRPGQDVVFGPWRTLSAAYLAVVA